MNPIPTAAEKAVYSAAVHEACNAAVNAAYADYKEVISYGDMKQIAAAWDIAIEKRDIAYARLSVALKD